MSTTEPPDGHRWPDVPAPVPDCAECDRLSARRTGARNRGDGTRETDANVLMRRHREQAHR